MKQGIFMLSEFIEIAIIGALFVTLFFGGYNLPWMNDTGFVFPGGHAVPLSHGLGRRTAAADLPGQGLPALQLPDPRAMDAAALPLGPAVALRLEVPAATGDRQPGSDGRRSVGAAGMRRATT